MSDVPQGPGWWQASDDKWYPPPRPTMPGEEEAAAVVTSAPPGGIAPPMGPPPGPGYQQGYGPPPGAPMGPQSYGGIPQGAPPGGGQNRTPLFVALGVVAAVAVVGVALVASSGGDDDDPPVTTASPVTTGSPDTTDGPDTTGGTDTTSGGSTGSVEDLEVVDSGFSNFPSQYDDGNHVSYGYILENTGDAPVANVEVTVTLLDSAGTVVSSDSDTIYLINPGARVGIGDEPYEELAEVAEIQVQPSIPSYAGEASSTGDITVEGINTTNDGSTLQTTFTASSTYDVQIDSPYAYIVYRNAAGEIVGGSYGTMNVLQAGGSTSGDITSYEVIPDVDPAQTEVYVDPGYIF